jgi:hypothetical protein
MPTVCKLNQPTLVPFATDTMKNFEVPKRLPNKYVLDLIGHSFQGILGLFSCCFRTATSSDFSAH